MQDIAKHHFPSLKRRILKLFAFLGIFLPFALLAAPPIPLEVESKTQDLAGLQEAIKGGFEDIIQAPLIQRKADYMEFLLTPNGFITNIEYRCAITFYQGKKGGILIKAVPFDIVNGKRVEVLTFGVRKGVYLGIEGAAQEMDYDVEMGGILGDFGGF